MLTGVVTISMEVMEMKWERRREFLMSRHGPGHGLGIQLPLCSFAAAVISS